MKTLIGLWIALFSTTALAADPCMTGSYYDDPGEGVNLQVLSPERTIGFWYGYGTDGGHRWYTLDFKAGELGKIYSTYSDRSLQQVGNATLDILDQDTILFVYDIQVDLDSPPWCLGCEGEYLLTRLTQPVECSND